MMCLGIYTHRIDQFGQFGPQTLKSSWRKSQQVTLDVSLKTTYTDEATESVERAKLLQEAAILAQFRHPNVVGLYGIINKDNTVRSLLFKHGEL